MHEVRDGLPQAPSANAYSAAVAVAVAVADTIVSTAYGYIHYITRHLTSLRYLASLPYLGALLFSA